MPNVVSYFLGDSALSMYAREAHNSDFDLGKFPYFPHEQKANKKHIPHYEVYKRSN